MVTYRGTVLDLAAMLEEELKYEWCIDLASRMITSKAKCAYLRGFPRQIHWGCQSVEKEVALELYFEGR